MEGERLEVGALLTRMWATISGAIGAAAGFFFAIAGLGSIIDLTMGESSGAYLLVTVASFVATYFLFRAMLHGSGLLREGEGGGFGVYFGVSFLGGLGMLLGFLFLIIPGLILMVRWSAAYGFALSEDRGATDALGESWEITRGSFWPILAVLLIGMVPLFVVMFGLGFGLASWTADYAESSTVEVVVINVVSTAYSVYNAAMGIAVYWMLRGERRDMAEVFA
jgi:hypothetical protein